MAVIQAVQDQGVKAEFAHRLAETLQGYPQVLPLFAGATSITTVCNMVAAIAYQVNDPRFTKAEISHDDLISVLHNCFTLLFVQEVQQGNISQAEHLILRISKVIAENTSEEQLSDDNLTRRQQMIEFSKQLDQLALQRRNAGRNMV